MAVSPRKSASPRKRSVVPQQSPSKSTKTAASRLPAVDGVLDSLSTRNMAPKVHKAWERAPRESFQKGKEKTIWKRHEGIQQAADSKQRKDTGVRAVKKMRMATGEVQITQEETVGYFSHGSATATTQADAPEGRAASPRKRRAPACGASSKDSPKLDTQNKVLAKPRKSRRSSFFDPTMFESPRKADLLPADEGKEPTEETKEATDEQWEPVQAQDDASEARIETPPARKARPKSRRSSYFEASMFASPEKTVRKDQMAPEEALTEESPTVDEVAQTSSRHRGQPKSRPKSRRSSYFEPGMFESPRKARTPVDDEDVAAVMLADPATEGAENLVEDEENAEFEDADMDHVVVCADEGHADDDQDLSLQDTDEIPWYEVDQEDAEGGDEEQLLAEAEARALELSTILEVEEPESTIMDATENTGLSEIATQMEPTAIAGAPGSNTEQAASEASEDEQMGTATEELHHSEQAAPGDEGLLVEAPSPRKTLVADTSLVTSGEASVVDNTTGISGLGDTEETAAASEITPIPTERAHAFDKVPLLTTPAPVASLLPPRRSSRKGRISQSPQKSPRKSPRKRQVAVAKVSIEPQVPRAEVQQEVIAESTDPSAVEQSAETPSGPVTGQEELPTAEVEEVLARDTEADNIDIGMADAEVNGSEAAAPPAAASNDPNAFELLAEAQHLKTMPVDEGTAPDTDGAARPNVSSPASSRPTDDASADYLDIAEGLTLAISGSGGSPTKKTLDTTERESNSPVSEAQLAADDYTVDLDADTAVLQDFLNRAAASKANRSEVISKRESWSNRRDSDAVRQALASPRKPLEDKDPNSPSPHKKQTHSPPTTSASPSAKDLLALNTDDETVDHLDVAPPTPPTRRSTRARTSKIPPPPSALPTPSRISIRTPSQESVVPKKTEAQELALLTRNNTRRNKGTARSAPTRLGQIKAQGNTASDDEAPVAKASVTTKTKAKTLQWDEQLVYYQTIEGDLAPLPTALPVSDLLSASGQDPDADPLAEDSSFITPTTPGTSSSPAKRKAKDSTGGSAPKVRRLRGLGATNGTPAKGLLNNVSLLPEAVQEERDEAVAKAQEAPKKELKLPKPAAKVRKTPAKSKIPATEAPPEAAQASVPEASAVVDQVEPKPKERKSRLAAPRKVVLPGAAAPSAASKKASEQTPQTVTALESTPARRRPKRA